MDKIKKLTEIIMENNYAKWIGVEQAFKKVNLGSIIPEYNNYRLLFWPRGRHETNNDNDSQIWIEERRGDYGGKQIANLKFDMFDTYEDMAYMIVSILRFCKKGS